MTSRLALSSPLSASFVLACAGASALAVFYAPPTAHACGTAGFVAHTIIASPTDVTPPTLTVGEVIVTRGWLDSRGYRCTQEGDIAIQVAATDDVSAPAVIGYSLEITSGALPAGATLPEVQRGPPYGGGAIHLSWYEGSAAAFEVCFAVRAVDEAGNISEPTSACAYGPPIDEGGTCSVTAPRGDTGAPMWACLAIATLGVRLLRSRRAH